MEHVDVVFTSYVSNGRCMVKENFVPPPHPVCLGGLCVVTLLRLKTAQ